MSIKRILTAAAASVVAVSAMAVVAFADVSPIESAIDLANDGSMNYQLSIMGLDVDVSKIASLDVTFSWDTTDPFMEGDGVIGGKVITQCDANSWNEVGDLTDMKSGEAVHVDVAGAYGADSTWAFITFQNYSPDKITLDKIVLNDADGNVLYTFGADAAAPADSTPEESRPEESKTDDNNSASNNVDTGVEGVAAVLGVAAVAAGAMIVAKKRK